MMIFFDLPTDTIKDRREYARFRKYLIKNGFVMMQESVYCKLILNQSAVRPAADGIRKNRPPKGLVQMADLHDIIHICFPHRFANTAQPFVLIQRSSSTHAASVTAAKAAINAI